MSEYQRYEFMTVDRPLTKAELDAVNHLSSHIEASSTHAVIEYNWGDFGHDPIKVLQKYFDGFLYWANWGSPQLAFRFPHGILPDDLLAGYDLEDFVTFTQRPDYDILDIQFGEMEAPGEWTEYDLGSLIAIRDELMEGDLRSLYIVWLASQPWIGDEEDEDEDEDDEFEDEDDEDEDEDNEFEDEEDEDEENEIIYPPIVPPALGTLTAAQQALAELLQVDEEMLAAAALHSKTVTSSTTGDNFVAWIELLPQERRNDYLVRLAHNEPGLSRLLARELRQLGKGETEAPPMTGERVTYTKMLAESKAIKARLEREKREQERLARQRHLQDIHDHQDAYWHQVNTAVAKGSGSGYDEATRVLVELREVAEQFQEAQEFQTRFRAWVRPHMRRPAFVKRLHDRKFNLPEA